MAKTDLDSKLRNKIKKTWQTNESIQGFYTLAKLYIKSKTWHKLRIHIHKQTQKNTKKTSEWAIQNHLYGYVLGVFFTSPPCHSVYTQGNW